MKRAVFLAVILLTSLLPVLPAEAQTTQIRFLNPSPIVEGRRTEVSDEKPVHIVAWVQDVPANPLVEFEFERVEDDPLGGGTATTVDAARVGTDTWEGTFTIPTAFLEGEYELRARIYSGTEEVAATKQTVTIDRETPPPTSEAVEIETPPNGGGLGFYTPSGKRPAAVIQVDASPGTDQVRVLYTKSAPGTQPAWIPCGSGRVEDSNVALGRCTLREGDSPNQVQAVAAVANNTPYPGTPEAAADDSSDAIRVSIYGQIPTSVSFARESGYEVEENKCQDFTFFVEDQIGQPIAGANVDIHAQGPTDQLRFGTNDTENPILPTNDPYQKPDKAHTSDERAVRCSDFRDAEPSQGDHNVIGGADRKHVESIAGTNNDGSFTFTLLSATKGGTVAAVWVDGDDDDSQSTSEASGFGLIGWGEEPPPPPRQIVIDPDDETARPGTCVRVVLQARQGDNILVNANVDVHIKGPNENVTFCSPSGGTAGRPPDAGVHAGDSHEDGTKHTEGETDGSGNFIFGITSSAEGGTDIGGWLDDGDDDQFSPTDPGNSASIFWGGGDGQRISTTLTIRYSAGALKGSVKASKPGCRAGRRIVLKKAGPGRDATVGTDKSSSRGNWKVRLPRARGKYYAIAASKRFSGGGTTFNCLRDRSPTITVRR